jgi:hypothetical protein
MKPSARADENGVVGEGVEYVAIGPVADRT